MERHEADCCLVIVGWTGNVAVLVRVMLKVSTVSGLCRFALEVVGKF